MSLKRMQLAAILLLLSNKMTDEEIEIEITNEGVMLINRQGNEHNIFLLDFLSDIDPANIDEIKEFLKENDVNLLFGDEILCG